MCDAEVATNSIEASVLFGSNIERARINDIPHMRKRSVLIGVSFDMPKKELVTEDKSYNDYMLKEVMLEAMPQVELI